VHGHNLIAWRVALYDNACSMEQLKENINAFDKELSAECLADIAAVYKKFRDPTIMYGRPR